MKLIRTVYYLHKFHFLETLEGVQYLLELILAPVTAKTYHKHKVQ